MKTPAEVSDAALALVTTYHAHLIDPSEELPVSYLAGVQETLFAVVCRAIGEAHGLDYLAELLSETAKGVKQAADGNAPVIQ